MQVQEVIRDKKENQHPEMSPFLKELAATRVTMEEKAKRVLKASMEERVYKVFKVMLEHEVIQGIA